MNKIKHIIKSRLKKAYIVSRIFLGRSVRTREDLPLLLNLLGIRGEAAEVGVHLGDFSEHIIKNSGISRLHSIDPWVAYDISIYTDTTNAPQKDMDERFVIASDKLKKYGKRSRVLRMTSEDAAKTFGPETLDFIFIDANHSYKSCLADLRLWWPKLKKGGMLALHDYLNTEVNDTVYGVRQAVDEFFRDKLQGLSITPEEWPTAYLIKDGSQIRRLLRLR